jgi:hypothetical protein
MFNYNATRILTPQIFVFAMKNNSLKNKFCFNVEKGIWRINDKSSYFKYSIIIPNHENYYTVDFSLVNYDQVIINSGDFMHKFNYTFIPKGMSLSVNASPKTNKIVDIELTSIENREHEMSNNYDIFSELTTR